MKQRARTHGFAALTHTVTQLEYVKMNCTFVLCGYARTELGLLDVWLNHNIVILSSGLQLWSSGPTVLHVLDVSLLLHLILMKSTSRLLTTIH